MSYKINFFSGKPIYQQISDYLLREIYSGRLKEGQSLPSVRSLAITNSVNPMTVSKALSALHKEGVLRYMAGKSLVVSSVEVSPEKKIALVTSELKELVVQARQVGASDQALIVALQAELARFSCGCKAGAESL